MKETTRLIAALKEMGCGVALDDFGAGYTSFRHLQELAIDVVKIDGSFVKTVADNANSQLFIEALQSFADGLGLETVAECVEARRIADLLARYGVSYMQGYHFGAPSLNRPWSSSATGLQVVTENGPQETISFRKQQPHPTLPAGGKVIRLITRH